MKNLFLLLSPRIRSFRNSMSRSSSGTRKKAFFMAFVCLCFWVLMFVLSSRVLKYFKSADIIGDLLAYHLLSMIFLTFFCLLIFSNIITSLSNLYLSDDLELCHSSPAMTEELFLSRAIYTLSDSSWMVIIFGMPIMMAYGWVYRPGFGFYISLIHLGLALSIIAAGLGILITMILVSIFPAQRTRDIIMLLMIFIIIALYFMFRFIRPERLVNPDAFFSVMQYVSALKAPGYSYLPTNWITKVLWSELKGLANRNNLFEILLLWSSACALTVINIWVANAVYFAGFSKSRESKRRRAGRGILDVLLRCMRRPLGDDLASILEKDIRNFFRDNTQWSQLLLLGALVVVYIYNFSVLPLDRSTIRLDFLENIVAFLNLGLASFVLAAVSVRFIFPAVSAEGRAFWIIQTSPLSVKRFLIGKYLIYILPMLILGETLIVITNRLLEVSTFMMVLSSLTMFFAVFGLVSLGIGLGAMYPKFKYENITQVATGFGGLVYMIVSALYMAIIILLESGPVYIVFMSDFKGSVISVYQWLMIAGAFLMALCIMVYTIYKPVKMGMDALVNYE